MVDEKLHAYGKGALELAGLSLSALLGVISTNYIGFDSLVKTNQDYADLIGGFVVFLIPVMLLGRKSGMGWGMAKLYLATYGLTEIARGLFGNANMAGLLNYTLPSQVSGVV